MKISVREALRESEERHRITLQMAMDGFFRANKARSSWTK
jgi:hypothetical protein